jgi:hypothetical protein
VTSDAWNVGAVEELTMTLKLDMGVLTPSERVTSIKYVPTELPVMVNALPARVMKLGRLGAPF